MFLYVDELWSQTFLEITLIEIHIYSLTDFIHWQSVSMPQEE